MTKRDLLAFSLRLLGGLRTTWLILGVTLGLFLGVEAVYRAIRRVAPPTGEDDVKGLRRSDHPYRDQPWYPGWADRRDAMLYHSAAWDPYRGWQLRAVSLPGLHVDAAGRRITPQDAPKTGYTRQVFFLGGSTMWGYAARDSQVIPALVARRLAERGISDVKMVNLANVGYNVTQEAITLMLELRRGNVPSLAVALDGVNDAGVVYTGNKVGDVQDQVLAERRFGRRSLLQDLVGRSAFLARLLILTSGERHPASNGASLCTEIAEQYSRMVRQIQALSRAHGFETYFLWQPTLARSRKPRTSWELWLERREPEFQQLISECSTRTDSIMDGEITYHPLHSLFDTETRGVFLDHWGHVTEGANDLIAQRIVELIYPALVTNAASSTASGTTGQGPGQRMARDRYRGPAASARASRMRKGAAKPGRAQSESSAGSNPESP